jgi:pyruvate/2-oxoglutarate dehydrogenase complex dihydrolipoamide dehydrogenase (E3) component
VADRYDLVIVGMGSGGMVAAEFAATLGLRVAAVERARLGGDCLWTGCVPSKTLIASARAAQHVRDAERFGINASPPTVDLDAVWQRVKDVQASIAATDDDPERYRAMGIELVEAEARIIGPNEVLAVTSKGQNMVGGTPLEARAILVCTGSHPHVPAIRGLADTGYVTSDTFWSLPHLPPSIVFVGGGPIAVELAQALNRLGVTVTILQKGPTLLPREEPPLVRRLHARLEGEGVVVHTGARVDTVERDGEGKVVRATVAGVRVTVRAAEVFVAAGRVPNVEGLGLDALGITVTERGIEVDDRGRTAVRSIYAVGDVAGRVRFTHSAGYEGVRAVRDAFFPGKGTVNDVIPWCTFTDPELAHVGLTVDEAEARYGDSVDMWRVGLEHSDRARADGVTEGEVCVVTARGKVVGAHILAPAAGEMIHELALAIRHDLKLSDVAALVHVYPTLATAVGQLAAESSFERARKLRWLVRKER